MNKIITTERNNRGSVEFRERIPLVLFIPLLITMIFYYFIDRDLIMYSMVVELFSAILTLTMGIIVILKRSSEIEDVYINIGIGFAIFSVLKFIEVIIIINFNDVGFDSKYRDILHLITFSTNYIILILALAFNQRTKNFKEKYKYKIYSVLVIVSIIAMTLIINYFRNNDILKDIICFAIIIVLAITSFVVLYTCKSIEKDEKIMFFIYLIFTGIYEAIYLHSYFLNQNSYFGEYFFKYLSFCVIYKNVEKNFFYKSYEKEKMLLEESQLKKTQLNKILKLKNKELTEIKSLIEKSEKRQRKLIDNIKDGIVIMTLDRVSYINESALEGMKSSGVSESLIGKSGEEMFKVVNNKKLLGREIIEEIRVLLSQEFEAKKLYKLMNVKRKGLEYQIYYVILNTVDRLFYIKDVTYINENDNLRNTYEKYLREENLKDEFYANISHELRTPINSIFSALQVNDIYLVDENSQGISKNNKTIKQNCLRLIRTINNFIDTNKISEGYLVPVKKVHNIVAIVENISLDCRKYIDRIENNLIFDSVDEEIYAEVDKDMIERVILNILSNSVKYGESGGTIFIDISKADNMVVIAIKNYFYTISEEIKPYIFDKFTKLNKALNREREGSGLGLFLTRALLELHNGTIDVKSNKEIGTEFIITIPIYLGKVKIENEEEVEISNNSDKVDTEFSDIYF